MSKESIVDLRAAMVGALTRRASHIAILFPRVPLLVRGGERDHLVPMVEAEIRIWGGALEKIPQRLPRRLSQLRAHWHRGARSDSLPLSFAASGEVCVTIDFEGDEPLIVRGSRMTLRVVKRVSQLARPAPRKSESGARQPRRRNRFRASGREIKP